MSTFNIETRRSYLMVLGFKAEDVKELSNFSENIGFSILEVKNSAEMKEAHGLIEHCLGLFVKDHGDPLLNKELIDLCLQEKVEYRFVSDSDSVPESHRIANSTKPKDFLISFLQDLVPEKLREVCLYSVRKVVNNLVPDFETDWVVSVTHPPLGSMDFLIFCEGVFDKFICAITVQSGIQHVASKSESLKGMSSEDVIEYFSEICNQVLGVVNLHLKKIDINYRIGLPMVATGAGISTFKRRSSYFLPVLNICDSDSGVLITFQFLFPFLKGATFSKELDFEVGLGSDENKLIML